MNEKPIKILLIEDDEDDYLLLKKILHKIPQTDYELYWAHSYNDAINELKQDKYDIYLADYRLGEKTGIDFIKHAQSLGSKCPFILLTGVGDEDLGIRALRAGADDYLIKSNITSPMLERAIRYAIERRQIFSQQQELAAEQIAREKVEKERKRLKRIVDSNMVGIVFYRFNGELTEANDAFLAMLGYTRDEFNKGKINWRKLTPPEFAHLDEAALEELRKRGVCSPYEKEFLCKDGSRVPVYIGCALFDQKSDAGVSFILDITDRKKLERQKDEFIAVATHELKTPVTSIKAYAQILRNRFEKGGDLHSSGLLGKMDAQLNKLIVLISDLLDVTKIEGGKLSLSQEKFDINILVKELVEELQRTTERHALLIEGEISRLVTADRDRTGQVLTNLISNAIKYSPHSKKIIIKINEDHDHIKIAVRDFGVGIPEDKQDKVFEQFYRVSGPKEDTYPGLGLGLYISSEIIKRQGGRIWVESTVGKGSTFYFTLPFTVGEIRHE